MEYAIKRRRGGGVLVMMGAFLVFAAGFIGITAAPASAHHPEISAWGGCDEQTWNHTLSWTAVAWSTSEDYRRTTPDDSVRVDLRVGTGSWAEIDRGEFNAGNGFTFSGIDLDADDLVGEDLRLRVVAEQGFYTNAAFSHLGGIGSTRYFPASGTFQIESDCEPPVTTTTTSTTTTTTTTLPPTTTTTLPEAFVRVTAICLEIDGDNAGLYKFRVRHEDGGGPLDYNLQIAGTVYHTGTVGIGETQYVWLSPPKLGVKVIPAGGWTNAYGGTASSNNVLCASNTTTTTSTSTTTTSTSTTTSTTTTIAGPTTTTTTIAGPTTTTTTPSSTTSTTRVLPPSTTSTTVAGPSTLPSTGGSGPFGSGTPIGFSLMAFLLGGIGLVLIGSGLVVIASGREREQAV